MCVGADATVRIISAKTGEVLTTSLVPDLTTIADAVYSAADGMYSMCVRVCVYNLACVLVYIIYTVFVRLWFNSAILKCFLFLGLLFTLLINGRILKSSTLTNPCTLQEVWEVKGIGI